MFKGAVAGQLLGPAALQGARVAQRVADDPISFVEEGAIVNYFSLITAVGTPQTIAAQELRVECMYPADDETEVLHTKLLAAR